MTPTSTVDTTALTNVVAVLHFASTLRHLLRLPQDKHLIEISHERICDHIEPQPRHRSDQAPAQYIFPSVLSLIFAILCATSPTIRPIHSFSTNVFGAPVM